MNAQELERYLHEHIPLSAAMQVAVEEVSEQAVRLRAPLAPNINHRETVFGGSASALAILSSWSLLHLRLKTAGVSGRLVIQRNSMEYERPISGEFFAESYLTDPEKWAWFLRVLARKGRSRIAAGAALWYEGAEAGRFEGEFVVLESAEAGRKP